ncbi:MAG: sugar ABC transporter permease, partial [Thermosphaera sp.]
DFLGSPNSALLTLVTANSWQFLPFGTLLILAGLQTIPRDVVEAAQVDGAGGWKRFWHILFPLLGPVIGFVFFLAFVWNFNTLAIVWLTTQGGPLNRTLTLPVFIYRRAFRGFAMGEAAAMGAMASVLLAIIGLFYFKYIWRKTP